VWPTVLAQLEGVVADGFGVVGHVRWSHFEKKFIPALMAGTADSMLGAHGLSLMQEMVLASFERGMDFPELNRHAILHGADTNYGNHRTALKAIILFDYIQAAFCYVASERGTCYHRPGCGALKRRPKKRRPMRMAFATSQLAEAAGFSPCQRCEPPATPQAD